MNLSRLAIFATLYFANFWKNAAIGADTYWNIITTSPHYVNYRMTTETNFRQRRVLKTWAHMDCATSCTADNRCRAFSFYEKDDYYACDLAGDNYCTNKSGKALIQSSGSFVWDKINPGMTTGCFKPAPVPCENIRSGCNGLYPNCTQCIQTCLACRNRYFFNSFRNCTLWPDGDGPDSEPVTVLCYVNNIVLVDRKVNWTTGEIMNDYRLSFEDTSRLHKLKLYPLLAFRYVERNGWTYYSAYKVPAIDGNGTLTNITHFSHYNIMDLLFNTPAILKFVTVVNDTFGCGSFWLLDPNNTTYCPGGAVRMLGTPLFSGSTLVSTGIRFGNVIPNAIFVEAMLYLTY